ncbi:TonB-dependent receptor [uncultured Flavobacterium sp.]|uniref:SusC/RagA family TonB-linked outer membrane protein n=1 Tax=uncultured Flavobacterium sp. TaxID=165435 RepID=UPI0025DC6C47|nr:TonB-dependent receptor [uncultured Flavobacterium sp.]
MKSKLFLIAFMLVSSFCFAQNVEISGTVNEAATGLPIPGVSIMLKNSTTGGTTTDIDGKFSISVPTGSTLVFSYIGFESQEVAATANESITISLKESTQTLDEVVLIGYGSQKRKEVTGAVGVVSAETIEKLRPVKIEQALQGTVSGVNVTTQSGSPGAGLSIRIRGVGTNGEAGPIAIIDGYQGELGLLNPQDIETITVLKDAQAAIYGTIGANGVILVTTKKGRKNQKPSLSYNFYTGFQETTRTLPTLNASQYAAYLNESFANNGSALPFPNAGGLGEGTNWQNEVLDRNVPIISHDLNLQGGSEKITYALSGSHIDQQGLVGGEKSAFLRNTARLSLGADITDKLKLNTNIIYTYFNRRNLNENALGSVLFNALNVSPLQKPRDEFGNFTLVPATAGFGNEIINPLAQIANTYNTYHFKKLNGTFGLDYEVIKGLTVTARMGFNTANAESKTFSPIVDYGGGKVFNNTRSSVTQGSVNDNSYTFDAFATYQKSIAESHNLTFTLGNTIYRDWGTGLYATGYDVPNNSWEFADINLANGLPTQKPVSSYTYDNRRLSYFGRLQYDYKGRYLLSAMIRRDMSTYFGPDNRVAYFPSFTGGWVVSDEPFFKQNNILSFAKVRASYGTLGNDQIPPNAYVSLLSGEAMYVFDGLLTAGTATGAITNPNVKWEEAKKFDVGVDLNFFNDDVTFVADYFVDTRKDLLIPSIPVSGILGGGAPGAGLPTVNAGDVKNYGVEFAIGYKKNITDDLRIDVNYNVTFLKNKVTKVDNGTGWLQGGGFGTGEAAARMEVGRPMGYFYGYRTNGIFQNQAEIDAAAPQTGLGANAETQPGDIRFVDMNGDGVINADDKTEIGDPIPSATMGFNLNLQYKGFDFTAYAFASIGNDMLRNYERTVNNANRLNYVLDRWTGEGTSNTVPRATIGATNNNVISDYFVEDASYLRIQNVQLGYTFDENMIGKSGISKVRLYVGVNNLYTFTKYMGYDPGASSGAPIGSGIDYGFYPIPRMYMVGANINF